MTTSDRTKAYVSNTHVAEAQRDYECERCTGRIEMGAKCVGCTLTVVEGPCSKSRFFPVCLLCFSDTAINDVNIDYPCADRAMGTIACSSLGCEVVP